MAAHKSTIVGAFVLGALALGIGAVLLFGGARLFATKVRAVVYFHDSVAGLTVGAPVTLRGVRIGTVRDVRVEVTLPDLVPVIPTYLEIEPSRISWFSGTGPATPGDVATAVKSGLRAQLTTQSLVTGQLAVNLDFLPNTPARLTAPPGSVPEIPSIPSDFQEVRDQIKDLKLAELAERARVTLTDVDDLARELHGKIGPMVTSIQGGADAARDTLQATTDTVKQLSADTTRTLNDLDRLAVTAQGQIEARGKQLDQVLAAAERATTKADKVIGALNDMTAPHSPMRGDMEAAIRDLAASAASLRDLSRELERHPNAALFGRPTR